MTVTIARLALAVGLFASLSTTLPGDVPCCDLRYAVRPDPAAGAVEIRLDLRGFDGDSLILERPSERAFPGLRGGDPAIEDVARGRWSLSGGAPRWAFARPDGGWPDPIRVRYRLEIGADRPIHAWAVGLDHDLLYAPAEALFLTPVVPTLAAQHAPVRVRWEFPDGWDALTGWDGRSFHGLRTLVKTNVLAGRIARHEASACGIEIEIGVHGAWKFDPEGVASDLARLACAARYRLGEPKVDRYAVSLVEARFPMTSGNRNGPNSIGFVHMVPDGAPPSSRLLAHELVHLWQRFDAPAWFLEGANDYMALRLAREAGLLTDDDLESQLAAIDSTYRAHPRRARWTFDDEAREGVPQGSSDEYLAYRKGALVGLALDRELRLRTGGEADLAALWREMNRRAAWGRVDWSDDAIEARAASLAGGSMDHFFATWVAGTESLPESGLLLANLPPPAEPRAARAQSGALAVLVETALARFAVDR